MVWPFGMAIVTLVSVTVEASEHGGAAKTAVPASSIAKAVTRRIIEILDTKVLQFGCLVG